MTTRVLRFAAIALASLLVASCGDGSLVEVPGEEKEEFEGQGYLMTIVTPMPLTIAPLNTGLLTVKLTKQGDPVAEKNIAFAVTGTFGGTRLGALRVTTGASGEATVEIIAGADDAVFEVDAESEFTNVISADVRVETPVIPKVTLNATISYPAQGQQPIARVEIGLHSDIVDCTALSTSPLPTALVLQELVDLAGTSTFTDLDADVTVTLLAVGFNVQNAAVAEGCVTGTVLVTGQNDVNIPMEPRSLRIEGVYDYTATFDMGNAIPGTAGTVIQTVGDIFDDPDDPGLYLVEQVEALLGRGLGIFQQTAVDLVNELIESFVPTGFLRFFEWVGDAAAVVSKLTVEGSLTIFEDANNPGALLAEETWETVVFTWRGGCDTTLNPLCDKRRIALRNTTIGELTMSYPVNHDDVIYRAELHDRSIPYARFFHLFILQVVYPEIIPGATDTGDILTGALDCVAIAEKIEEADGVDDGILDLSIVTFTVTQLEGYCNQALNLVGSLIDGKLDDLAGDLPSTVTLTGAAEIDDSDNDLLNDALNNGVWSGTIDVDGASEPVSGTFSGTRQ